MGRDKEEGTRLKVYDDDLVRTVSDEFNDKLRAFFVIGDAFGAFGGSLHRNAINADEFIKIALTKIVFIKHILEETARLTKVAPIVGFFVVPFMNGGPAGENWIRANNCFYNWIDNKSQESILGIDLGFKADNYDIEVSNKLIAKKKANRCVSINLLRDGFVSILMQKPPSNLSDIEENTIRMIDETRCVGINVFNKDSWNPLSGDFLSANHIKLWVFDWKSLSLEVSDRISEVIK